MIQNSISTAEFNSRDAANLAAGATFQGVGEQAYLYARAGIHVRADNATDGVLTIESSHDGITYGGPTKAVSNTLFAAPHMWNIVARWFRIKYVNGTTEATNLSIQTQFSNSADVVLAHQLDAILPVESEATLTRPTNSFDLDQARKHLTGQRAFFFFGFNEDIDTGVWEDVHPTGGNVNWLTTATKVEVLSSHAADTAAGLGVQSVEIHGLSATGADQDEVIAMNGTSAVESALTYIRLNKMHNEAVGTYGGSHQGDVTCRVTSGGAVLSVMKGIEGAAGSSVQYGLGEANNGFWSVPLGKVAYLTELEINISTTGDKHADVALYEREGILDVTTPFDPRRVIWNVLNVKGLVRKTFKSHIKIKGLTDLFFRAQASDDDTKIAVSLDFYLLDADAVGA